jgi:predicted DNA-binding WGR domain protein
MNKEEVIQEKELGYTKGNSDKVYILQLLKTALGYRVKAQYGKRYNVNAENNMLSVGNISLEKAQKIFDKILYQKLKKGYVIEYEIP